MLSFPAGAFRPCSSLLILLGTFLLAAFPAPQDPASEAVTLRFDWPTGTRVRVSEQIRNQESSLVRDWGGGDVAYLLTLDPGPEPGCRLLEITEEEVMRVRGFLPLRSSFRASARATLAQMEALPRLVLRDGVNDPQVMPDAPPTPEFLAGAELFLESWQRWVGLWNGLEIRPGGELTRIEGSVPDGSGGTMFRIATYRCEERLVHRGTDCVRLSRTVDWHPSPRLDHFAVLRADAGVELADLDDTWTMHDVDRTEGVFELAGLRPHWVEKHVHTALEQAGTVRAFGDEDDRWVFHWEDLPPAPDEAAERVLLQFAWPRGSVAEVHEKGTYDGREQERRYRVTWCPQNAGRRRCLTFGDVVFNRLEGEAPFAIYPDLLLSLTGERARLRNWRSSTRHALEILEAKGALSDRELEELDRVLRTPEARAIAEAEMGDLWGWWCSSWLGLHLAPGEETTFSGPLPRRFAASEIPETVSRAKRTYRVVRRLFHDGGECVHLTQEVTADPRAARALVETSFPELPPEVAREDWTASFVHRNEAYFEIDTMLPHWIHTTTITTLHVDGEEREVDRDEVEHTFRWGLDSNAESND